MALSRDSALDQTLPAPSVQRHESGQWGDIWRGDAESSPSAFPSKRAALQSGQKQPEGIQGSPVTGISPAVQYHLPQMTPHCTSPVCPSVGTSGVGFLLSEEGKSNCRPCPRAMGTPQFSGWARRMWVSPHLVQQELFLNVASHRVPDGCSLWKAKENQVALCVCWLATLQHPLSCGALADVKCHCSPLAQMETPLRRLQC